MTIIRTASRKPGISTGPMHFHISEKDSTNVQIKYHIMVLHESSSFHAKFTSSTSFHHVPLRLLLLYVRNYMQTHL